MAYVGVLGDIEVAEYGPRRHYRTVHAGYAETLKVSRLEVLQQAVGGSLLGENPVLKLESEIFGSKRLVEMLAIAALYEHLLWREISQELVDVVGSALGGEILARADVEKRHPAHLFPKVHRSKEIVLAVIQNIVVDRHAGRHKLGDSALHELFGQLRILKLLANRHALPRTHELWQIGVQGVMRKPGKRHILRLPVGAAGERDAQNLRRRHGIVGKSLVEVAHTKQQHRIGMLCFHLEVLLHERGLNNFLCHRV